MSNILFEFAKIVSFVALSKEYERCLPNVSLYRYRMVLRFCKCNFGNIDNIAGIVG